MSTRRTFWSVTFLMTSPQILLLGITSFWLSKVSTLVETMLMCWTLPRTPTTSTWSPTS